MRHGDLIDSTFVEDAGWHEAAKRYQEFLRAHQTGRVLYWEFGIGANTPGIIKYPFWRMTAARADVTFVSINKGMAYVPDAIAARSIVIDGDIAEVLRELL